MGNINVCTVKISFDAIFAPCVQCFITEASYISKLEDNLLLLPSELQKLINKRDDVMKRVNVGERSLQMERTGEVQGWLLMVQAAENQVAELQKLKDEETQKLCLGGYFSNDCKSSYDFGKRVHEMLQKLTTLKTEGDFKNVAEKIPEAPVVEIPIDPTLIVGLQSTIDKVWTCLGDQQAGIIGLWGMGGVGKTTLLTQINNKFLDTPNDFDVVIRVVVSKDQKLEMIQETIGKRIGLWNDSWKTKRLEEQASDIFNNLKQKRFVLLLDDIWERVDLMELGVPPPSPKISSKIVFTTRFNEVCGHMEANKQFKVECLAPEEAWKLFEMKVGRETVNNDPDILQVAQLVAEECDGLPLALITIGRAMACKKTVEEWNHAIQILKKSAFEFSGMEVVYSRLKFSYDSLASDTLRSCLLYCSLFPEDYEIEKRDLIDFWIGEGFFDEYETGYSVIGDLLRACLLEEEDDDHLKMHDVIRDMALWIACEIEKEKGKFLVQTSVGLTEAPETERWEGVKRMSLMGNRIENLLEIPSCPHLSTLFLNENSLKMINNDFFRFMPSLKVLNLSSNYLLVELPLGISRLVTLQHLDLSNGKIKELPEELKALANLRCLNLGNMSKIIRVPRRLISSFAKLCIFRLWNYSWDLEPVGDHVLSGGGEYLVEELLCLKYLKALSIQLKGSCAVGKLLKSQKLQSCTQFLYLEGLEESLAVLSLTGMKHLYQLAIINSSGLEELKIDYCPVEIQKIRESHCFHSLGKVVIYECIRLRDATWLVFAPNLKFIWISNCGDMEEVISVEKCGQVKEEIESLNPFAKLESLKLFDLRRLKSIYWKPLPFPHLKEITALDCPSLEKLPLDFNNVEERKIVFNLDPHLSEELKREDLIPTT